VAIATGVTPTDLYTCPAGKVALIKSIRVVQADGLGASIVRLRIGGTGDGTQILRTSVASGATYVDPDTDPVVLSAGESVSASTATNAATVTLSGAELEA
jgi:hypothetical protein